MGKKDLFKFPSKKTLEYILIGILFVAVLSCTMKMMNISFNNILEGFDCDQRTGEGTCTRLLGDTPATAKHFIGDSVMSNLTTTVSGDLTINFLKGGARNEVVININNGDGESVTIETLLSNLTDSIASSGIGSEVIVFKSTDNKLNILTLPDSEITDIRMRYAASAPAQQTTEVGNLQRVLGVNDFSSLNVSDKETCEQYFTLLEGNYDLRTDANANAKLTLGSTQKCLTGCEEESLGECPSDGVNTGCALNSDSDTCVCGGSTGLGSFVRNSDYNFDDNDVDNCLKSQITDIYGNEPGILGTRPGGWTTDGTGDVCSPRRPCLDNQEAYLNIIRKSSTSDTPSENCNPENDYGDNEMRLNFCQPFGEAATFANCNKHNNQTDCETEGSETDNTQCTWNPYCLSQEGLDEVIGGAQEDPSDRFECQKINDHQSCNAAPQCYWDWILAEELNGFRGDNNRITEDTPKINTLKEPGLFTTDLSNCQTDGGTLDNSKCSFYSAIQTLNSTDNRAKGYCRKEDCDYDEGTEHSLCSYCSTFALEDNTPSIVPETISDIVEWTREKTGTSNSQSQQATPNQCYQIFRR